MSGEEPMSYIHAAGTVLNARHDVQQCWLHPTHTNLQLLLGLYIQQHVFNHKCHDITSHRIYEQTCMCAVWLYVVPFMVMPGAL